MSERRTLRRAMDVQYRFLDWWRHPASARAASEPPSRGDFAALRQHDYCLLVTYKRSGEAVATPISCGVGDDGRAYVRSESHVAKIRRLRRNPRVALAPCTIRGKPLGPAVAGHARVLPPEDAPRADAIMRAAYGRTQALMEGALDRLGLELTYVEISPEAG